MAVEANVLRTLDQNLDGLLVVQNHLRFAPVLALRLFAEFDETRRIEQGVGVALETARVPGQVNQKPTQYPLHIGARGLFAQLGRTDLPELCPLLLGEMEGFVRTIGIEELPVIPDRPPRCARLPDVVPDLPA